MTRNEAIERWRGREVQETAAIVLHDKDLQRLLAAWPHAPRTDTTPAWQAIRADSWEDLWRGVEVDEPTLFDMTGLQPGPARVAYRRAVALRLIYPDGSLHQVGRLVLQKLIKDSLTKGRKA